MDPSNDTVTQRNLQYANDYALLSPNLRKSLDDDYSYQLKLRTGEIINYSNARLVGSGWIQLGDAHFVSENAHIYSTERGVDVRITDIVWVIDDPS